MTTIEMFVLGSKEQTPLCKSQSALSVQAKFIRSKIHPAGERFPH